MKAQSSIELLVTLGVVLAFSIPAILLLLTLSNTNLDEVALYQAKSSAKKLADVINSIYLEGEGAKTTFILYLPSSSNNFTIVDRQIVITMDREGKEYEIIQPILCDVENPDGQTFTITKNGLIRLYILSNGKKVIMDAD